MIALVDCNNFYVSCERLFNPKLRRRPVIVLSNNDGCVVARSPEAKSIGIKMGVPLFQIEHLLSRYEIAVFSSNYTLYGDLSSRVMEALHLLAPQVENYSIDEAFLKLDTRKRHLESKGQRIREQIYRWTGIPVSVGIAPNKTLAKIANLYAKKDNLGVFDLTDERFRNNILKETSIIDIWGIGYRSALKLKKINVTSAYDLQQLDRREVKKLLTVTGARIARELRGESCLPLELCPPDKKSITSSRSFGMSVVGFEGVLEALYSYVSNACAKLRKGSLSANALTVFIKTNPYAHTDQYSNSHTIELANPSNSTLELRAWAKKALTQIFRDGYYYKKVGVILQGLQPEPLETIRLYNETAYAKDKRLMAAMDAIKAKFGGNAVTFGMQRHQAKWGMRAEWKSQRYTSCLNEIPTVS
jgi:DNA polymerase V